MSPRHSIERPLWALAALAVAMTACGDSDCPEGRVARNGRCVVPEDAADASTDSRADAGGTGGGTGGATGGDSGAGGASSAPDAAPEASPCESIECNENAHCLVADGGAVCKCNEGYEGDGVDTCDRNECIALGDAGSPCGVNTTCEDPSADDEDFQCACEAGFAHCEAASDAGAGITADGGPAPGVGCETRLETDPDHCGECSFSCAGSLPCSDGKCEQIVGVLATGNHQTVYALLEPANEQGAREVMGWGSNNANLLRDPALGTDTDSHRTVPEPVPGLDAVRDLATGTQHTCILLGDADTVRCWGAALTEPNSTDPVPVTDFVDREIQRAREVAAGSLHTCVRLSDGTVQCWGNNSFGQLAQPPSDLTDSSTPEAIANLDSAVEIEASVAATCARTETGRVACWGSPFGTEVSYLSSGGSELDDAIQIDVSTGYMCALRETGSIVCSGSNDNGQLGDPSAAGTVFDDFVTVEDLTDAIDIATGNAHACSLDQSGQVWCWGSSQDGELRVTHNLDTPSDDPVRSPARVVGLTDVIDIEAAKDFTCARRETGQVICWGVNDLGQLGDGTRSAPDPGEFAKVKDLP